MNTILNIINSGLLPMVITAAMAIYGIIKKKDWDATRATRAIMAGVIQAAKEYNKVGPVSPEDAVMLNDRAKKLADDLLGPKTDLTKVLGGNALVDAQIITVHNELQAKGIIK